MDKNYIIFNIKSIHSHGLGLLSYFEGKKDIPFEIKRVYYISSAPETTKRGFHAHKKLKQLLFCPYGRIRVVLSDGNKSEEIILDDPSKAIYIYGPLWREMTWEVSSSVLVVAASEYFSEADYIRNYDDFIKFIGEFPR